MSDFRTPPIKRHEALIPLSRDHYVGLVHANRMKKSATADRVARHKAIAEFLDAWKSEIEPHFRDEERLLIPLIQDESDRRRLLDEHARLREGAGRAANERKSIDPDPGFVEGLGRDLEQHIRWEERVLFNSIQDHATADQLEHLSKLTAEVERARNRGRIGDEQERSGDP